MIKIIQWNKWNNTTSVIKVVATAHGLRELIKSRGYKLPELEIFTQACINGEVFFSGNTYHKSLEELKKELGRLVER